MAVEANDAIGIQEWCKHFYQKEAKEGLLDKNHTASISPKFIELNNSLTNLTDLVDLENKKDSQRFLEKLKELGSLILEAIKTRLAGITKPLLPAVVAGSFIASPVQELQAHNKEQTPNPLTTSESIENTTEDKKDDFMYPNERSYYAQVLSQLEGYPISMIDIKNDGRGVWAVTNDPEPNKEYTIFSMPRKTSGIIPREIPYKEGTYKTWEDLEATSNQALESQNTKTQSLPITLVSVNHFKMDLVDEDLQKFKTQGASTLAVELPSNLQGAIDKFLQSPQTTKDELEFGQEWNNLVVAENIESVKSTLESITGNKVTNSEVIDSMQVGMDNPMDGNTTLKYLMNTIVKAHNLGFDIQAIDCSSGLGSQDLLEDQSKVTEHRNNTMANNLANLANLNKNSQIVAIVGALHTDPSQKETPIQDFLKNFDIESKVLNYENKIPEEKERTENSKKDSKITKKFDMEMGM
jgi:hypothetical protein